MKTPFQDPAKSNRQRGSVLVVCLVLAAFGTIGVAAWFSLVDARSQQVETNLAATQRRVALRNGRSLAHRALYASQLHADAGLAQDLVCSLPDGKGSATIRSYSTAPLSNETAGAPARDGATPLASRGFDVAVDLGDGVSTTRWTYRLRNQHPGLGGDLLSLYAPAAPTDSSPLVSGNLSVRGRAVFWDAIAADLGTGLRADEFLLPNSIAGATTFATVSGAATLPLNYPHYLRTTGLTSAGPSYRGELELFDATVNPQNSYLQRLGPSPISLEGSTPTAESDGPATIAPTPEDPVLLQQIDTAPPDVLAGTLAGYPQLSSAVLLAAVAKLGPLDPSLLFQVFQAQSSPPDDALAAMMAAVDENSIPLSLDRAILDFNTSKGTAYTVNGTGTATVHLANPGVERLLAINVRRLRLVGQRTAAETGDAETRSPLLVVVANRAGVVLEEIDFLHANARPFVLVSVSTTPAFPAALLSGTAAFPDWRMVADLQNTGLAFDLSAVAGARLVGGIRGNHRIAVAGGTLTIDRDPAGAVLAPLLSRDAWIECVRN